MRLRSEFLAGPSILGFEALYSIEFALGSRNRLQSLDTFIGRVGFGARLTHPRSTKPFYLVFLAALRQLAGLGCLLSTAKTNLH